MAQLTTYGGQYFKLNDDDSIEQLTPDEYFQEKVNQRQVQEQGLLTQLRAGHANYVQNTLSGARELTYGDPQQEQQLRAQLAQDMKPWKDYGGMAVPTGEFFGAGSTGLLPGGIYAQSGIGGAQGAAERPDAPMAGFGIGVASTLFGDWVGDVVGRIGSRLLAKRMEVSPGIRRAEDAGIEFTPGKRTGDIQRQLMEAELAKNPLFAGIDAPRFLRNRQRLNNLAADYLGVPRTGKMTGEMLGEAYDQARKGFKVMDNYEGPIEINPDRMIEVWEDLTPEAQQFMTNFVNKYKPVIDGPVPGKTWNQARNWLAEQTRRGGNKRIREEIQGIIGVMDDGAMNSVDEVTAAGLDRARGQWKAMLVMEGAQSSAKSKAAGDVLPASAYRSLEKYYGRRFRHGRIRDPFMDAVRGMTEAGESAPPVRPSGNAPMNINPIELLQQRFYQEPLARSYMKGNKLSEILLGASLMDDAIPGADRLGIGAARGIMAQDEEQ